MFGAYPFASIPFAASSTDASTVPAVQDLIADQESPRAYLFHATPYDPVGAAETDVRASIGLQYPIVDSVHWPAYLKTACDSQVELFGDDEDAQGRTSFGNLELLIGDGERDELAGYFWDGRSVEVMLGADGFTLDEYKRVLFGTAEDVTYGQRKLGIVFRGKEALLDKPIQESLYTGAGGLEGGDDLADSEKPLAFGPVRNVTPIEVDQTSLIYQFHDGAAQAVTAAYDGGVVLASAGDVADITVAVVAPGYYKTQLSGGYVRVGAVPEKALTLDVEGSATGGYAETVPDIIQRLCVNYTDLTTTDLNLWSFFTANLDGSRATCGLYVRGQSVQEAITALMTSIGGAWTFNREGRLTLAVLRKRRSVGTITENDIVRGTFKRERTPAPSWQRRISHSKSWTTQTEDQLLGAASEAQRAFVAQEYRYVATENAAIKTRRAGARVVEKETLLATATAAQTELARQQALFGGDFDRVNLTAKRVQFKYQVGQTLTVEYPRFDFPKDMVILGIRENTSSRQTTLRLWG